MIVGSFNTGFFKACCTHNILFQVQQRRYVFSIPIILCKFFLYGSRG